jgi:hypothetical protein
MDMIGLLISPQRRSPNPAWFSKPFLSGVPGISVYKHPANTCLPAMVHDRRAKDAANPCIEKKFWK